MRTGILIAILSCSLLSYAHPTQQILYPNRRHSSSHGGYITVKPCFSHKGGLFRKQPRMKPDALKPKPVIKSSIPQKPAPQVF